MIFYSLSSGGLKRPLKIDFVEEVLIEKPRIRRMGGPSVYDVGDIYFHKIAAIAGSGERRDSTGRTVATGRNEPRDAFDIFVLSEKIRRLHLFLATVPRVYQRGFVQWARTYSRTDLKIAILDLDIYLDDFDVREMIAHIDAEVKEFIRGIS